jgi:flagellar basal body-associated protein FliL
MANSNQKDNPKHSKHLTTIITVIIIIAFLALGAIFWFYYESPQSNLTNQSLKNTPAGINDQNELNKYQYYGKPLDSQNIGRPDPFAPY